MIVIRIYFMLQITIVYNTMLGTYRRYCIKMFCYSFIILNIITFFNKINKRRSIWKVLGLILHKIENDELISLFVCLRFYFVNASFTFNIRSLILPHLINSSKKITSFVQFLIPNFLQLHLTVDSDSDNKFETLVSIYIL